MSLLFICLTFIFAFHYRELRKPQLLAGALVCYFLAFLSKEYAVTLVALLPLSFYIFNKDTIAKSMLSIVALFCRCYSLTSASGRIVIGPRNDISDNDIQINPYAFATSNEKLATEIATSLNYLKLLLVPRPLSSDYSLQPNTLQRLFQYFGVAINNNTQRIALRLLLLSQEATRFVFLPSPFTWQTC